MNAIDKTAARANAIAFMTTKEADIYLAECKKWDEIFANMTPSAPTHEMVEVTLPVRKLFAPTETKMVKVETVTALELKAGDRVIWTEDGENWTVPVVRDSYKRSDASWASSEAIITVFAGPQEHVAASRTYRRVI